MAALHVGQYGNARVFGDETPDPPEQLHGLEGVLTVVLSPDDGHVGPVFFQGGKRSAGEFTEERTARRRRQPRLQSPFDELAALDGSAHGKTPFPLCKRRINLFFYRYVRGGASCHQDRSE